MFLCNAIENRSNRLQTVTQSPDSGKTLYTTTYGYDNASNVTGITDARNFPSTFSYDPMGRLTGMTRHIDMNVPPTLATTTLGYDKVGNVTSVIDPRGGKEEEKVSGTVSQFPQDSENGS